MCCPASGPYALLTPTLTTASNLSTLTHNQPTAPVQQRVVQLQVAVRHAVAVAVLDRRQELLRRGGQSGFQTGISQRHQSVGANWPSCCNAAYAWDSQMCSPPSHCAGSHWTRDSRSPSISTAKSSLNLDSQKLPKPTLKKKRASSSDRNSPCACAFCHLSATYEVRLPPAAISITAAGKIIEAIRLTIALACIRQWHMRSGCRSQPSASFPQQRRAV